MNMHIFPGPQVRPIQPPGTTLQVTPTIDSTSPAFDAFNRQRMTELVTIFDSKQILTGQAELFVSGTLAGTGCATNYYVSQSSTYLSVSLNTAGTCVRQSVRYMSYQPGKSHLILTTFNMLGGFAGIRKKVGYFDAFDGLFLELSGTSVGVVKRTSTSGAAVDSFVTQSSWNIDRFDGTGPSGVIIDFTKTQILMMDMEWLGVGSVRYGFVIDGVTRYAHQLWHANTLDKVYMKSPNLPIRYEISNDGTGPASALSTICCTVASEGGRTNTGFERSVSRELLPLVTLNDKSFYPLVSIRLRTGCNAAYVQPGSISILCTSTAAYAWKLILNPTFVGTAPVWSPVTSSCIEASFITTNATTVVGGIVMQQGYGMQQNEGATSYLQVPDYAMGNDVFDNKDVVCLAVARATGTTETFYGAITWHETL
jgi:hypothetical protein